MHHQTTTTSVLTIFSVNLGQLVPLSFLSPLFLEKIAFSALILLTERQSIWPAKNLAMRCWRGYLSGARHKHLHVVQLMPLKSRRVYLSGASLSRLSWKRGH